VQYTVDLDAFHGPLDLLLYLVRRDEVDILDVPVTRLAEQFLDFLKVMKELDVELAGDFLVMAATLMEIKAKSLLPKLDTPADDDRPDPHRELVAQLLEYRQFKDAAQVLEQRAESQATRLPRTAPPEVAGAGQPPGVKPVELWDLVSAFARILRETQGNAATVSVLHDETPQATYEAQIRAAVALRGRVALRDLVTPPVHRLRLIGLFLAMLEVIKLGQVRLEQLEPYGEIDLLPALRLSEPE
jgi:segregation and condensation protein A